MSEQRKPFNDIGIVAGILGALAFFGDGVMPRWELAAYGEALLLMSVPCFLAQIVVDQRRIRR